MYLSRETRAHDSTRVRSHPKLIPLLKKTESLWVQPRGWARAPAVGPAHPSANSLTAATSCCSWYPALQAAPVTSGARGLQAGVEVDERLTLINLFAA